MQSQEIEITIWPDGRVEYHIKGLKGNACDSISAMLEKLGHVEQEERTGEYWEGDGDERIHITG